MAAEVPMKIHLGSSLGNFQPRCMFEMPSTNNIPGLCCTHFKTSSSNKHMYTTLRVQARLLGRVLSLIYVLARATLCTEFSNQGVCV